MGYYSTYTGKIKRSEIIMNVTKSVSIKLEDLTKIQDKIKEEKYVSFSEFVQKAIKHELEDLK